MAAKKITGAPGYPLLYIEWEDHAGSDGWSALDDAVRSNDESCLCQTVGWLIAENKERITVVSSIGPATDTKPKSDVAGQMTIAKALIKTRRVIKVNG